MRTPARESTGPRAASPAPSRALGQGPDRAINPLARVQRALGNEAVHRAVIARADSAGERRARTVGDRARPAPAGAAPLVGPASADGVRGLSASGRRHFEPMAGPGVERARLHVNERAEHVARLAGARAVTWGDDVFIPPAHFAPGSAEGRALLGHELAHVAHADGPAQIFRQPRDEPHYPTEDEQRQLEKIMSREFKDAPPTPTGPNAPVVKRGRALTADERTALAARLEDDYLLTLATLDRGKPSGGGLSEAEGFEVATEAREAIYKRFGAYIDRNVTLTRDEKATTAARAKANQVLVSFKESATRVDDLGRTIATTHCKPCLAQLAPLDDDSKAAVIHALIEAARSKRGDQLDRVALNQVPGGYRAAARTLRLDLRPARDDIYDTAVHELIHALAHPAFRAAFGDEDNINEGFTEYFATQIFGAVDPNYEIPVATIKKMIDAMGGPFPFTSTGGSAEESLRLAYFAGRLDLVGWKPSSPDEQAAVDAAGGAAGNAADVGKPWDAGTARKYADKYRAEAIAKQAAARNVLGVGLFFTPRSEDRKTINVRYARVLARTEPYAKGQLFLEGQLWGTPTQNPRLGGSLGLGLEYQEPHFYLNAGGRFVGSAVPGADASRLDVSPFAGAGVRWQGFRVGAEGWLQVPVLGETNLPGGKPWGVGLTVGVELK